MSEASFQTVRLARGKHSSARHGACVMELASMLAGEGFTDRPMSVSPVIAAFLRGYNDLVEDHERQDLLPYASEAVGTAGSRAVEQARVRRVIEWADERIGQRPRSRVRDSFGAPWERRASPADPDGAGIYAIRSIHKSDCRVHTQALALVDELIGMGNDRNAAAAPARGEGGADHGSASRAAITSSVLS